jgi:hypothetical protein
MVLLLFPFYKCGTKHQRGQVTFPKSHSNSRQSSCTIPCCASIVPPTEFFHSLSHTLKFLSKLLDCAPRSTHLAFTNSCASNFMMYGVHMDGESSAVKPMSPSVCPEAHSLGRTHLVMLL